MNVTPGSAAEQERPSVPAHVDVLVVGAGPVGLAAALLLQRAGLTGAVLERKTELGHHPKARGIRLRASELMRIWGFDEALRARSMPGETHRFIYTEALSGEEIARTPPGPAGDDDWASAERYRVAQDELEAVLDGQVAIECEAVDVLRGYEVVGVENVADGVIATVLGPGGARLSIHSSYLIAADGVGSRVRTLLGLTLGDGRPAPYWQSVYWRGDLSAYTADRPAIMYYTQTGGDSLVGIAPAGGRDRWVTIVQRPVTDARPDALTCDEAVALIRSAVGVDDLTVDVVSSATFRISADVLEHYRVGRVFFAGDSAHSLPPTGGFGINTGFADIHNLVFKLAWVLRGVAPDSLLDSYESERQLVARSNAEWSSVNAKRMIALKKALAANDRPEIVRLVAEQAGHVDPLDQDLGFTYATPAATATPSATATPAVPAAPAPDARPSFTRLTLGARAPHARVLTQRGERSTHDLFEGRLTLVVAPHGDAWIEAAAALPPNLALQTVRIGSGPLLAADAALAERYDFGDVGAGLIRPDGHVAWITHDEGTERPLSDAITELLATGIVGAPLQRATVLGR
ncbi:FAD-dependent monooxygenase [Subtercola lobariae]|uniref:FAD-dependent oxidoreductase n=1 Tax=Subtercola lobariae TaxID=1588641 RepID=A0A917AZC0_9MICO|nr:FAD-dependent monooxygenase [Subtercola lobariae]GGF11814.1 FAD-dependent oxidoreductase [Subtercola lobariae]